MKTLYNYIMEQQNQAYICSLTFGGIDDSARYDLEQICNEHNISWDVTDDGPTGEGPWEIIMSPVLRDWNNVNFVNNLVKFTENMNPSGKITNIRFINVTGFKYEALINYLKSNNLTDIEDYGEEGINVLNTVTSEDIKEFLNILENVNESVCEAYGCTKETFKKEWEKMLSRKTPCFTFPNGTCIYINYNEEDDCLEAGFATNAGVDASYSLEIDYDNDLDYALNELYEMIIDENPEYIDED